MRSHSRGTSRYARRAMIVVRFQPPNPLLRGPDFQGRHSRLTAPGENARRRRPTFGRLGGMDDDPVAAARRVIRELFGAVRWAVLSGSVLTEARTPGSDLDIVVVVDPQPGVPYRRSLTFAGWPVELFVHDSAGLDHRGPLRRDRSAGVRRPSDRPPRGSAPQPRPRVRVETQRAYGATVIHNHGHSGAGSHPLVGQRDGGSRTGERGQLCGWVGHRGAAW